MNNYSLLNKLITTKPCICKALLYHFTTSGTLAGAYDFTVCCANDKDGKNMKTLGIYAVHFVEEPSTATYKKVNFYTCKYFEGWDLFDKDATAILVTDVHKQHTKVAVGIKGKQAIGRIRENKEKQSNLYQIIHIINHSNNKSMKTAEQFKKEFSLEAKMLIKQNEERVMFYKEQESKVFQDERLIKFADIDKETKLATLDP